MKDEGVAEKPGRSEATEDFVARGSRVFLPDRERNRFTGPPSDTNASWRMKNTQRSSTAGTGARRPLGRSGARYQRLLVKPVAAAGPWVPHRARVGELNETSVRKRLKQDVAG